MPRISFGRRTMPLPRNRLLRLAIGGLLVLFGLVGFLPILGFWMVPLGLMVLSIDLPPVRRLRRRAEVAILRRWYAWRGRRSGSAAPRG